MISIVQRIATELEARPKQIEAAVRLLDEGATVPFIARYRKEVTGGLSDAQLRLLEERLGYLRDLEARRSSVLTSIEEQGKLTAALRQAILDADTKTRLEDLYLPYRPKRRTKAQIARTAGLAPLAEGLLTDPWRVPEAMAATYVDAAKGVPDGEVALEGARQILMEQFAEDAELVGALRDYVWEHARLRSTVQLGKEQEGVKYSDYFDRAEPLAAAPSHRALALLRGRKEGVLRVALDLQDPPDGLSAGEQRVAARFGIADKGRPADAWLLATARWAWKAKILVRIELDLLGRLREAAEAEAIRVFARNLHDLLLAAPAGPRVILGLDPGLRTGVKVAVVDSTGKVLDTATIYPHAPKNAWEESLGVLARLVQQHGVELLSIGNGTASRETDRLAVELLRRHPALGLQKVVVSEAGASVYSASETASRELPQLDVSLRGAVSIARRLQDPLAELVKIEPRSIGVGQYQHDVSQTHLSRTLDGVVEDCVNAVGVDVNTASVPLLARVSGVGPGLAESIVAYRDEHGAFRNRQQLQKIPRLGPKTFEQCAGFLRVMVGDNPLDRSAVHPEAYPVVQRIVAASGTPLERLVGNKAQVRRLDPAAFVDERFGLPTVTDILTELEKPGRDPRPELKTARFREGVETLADLKPEMVLEGVVTNVANFGAFVDIGVHQDGLVHVSNLADRYVRDPHQVVKTGDVVQVKVLEVDLVRRRIGLTMRLQEQNAADRSKTAKPQQDRKAGTRTQAKPAPQPPGAMAEALTRALKPRS